MFRALNDNFTVASVTNIIICTSRVCSRITESVLSTCGKTSDEYRKNPRLPATPFCILSSFLFLRHHLAVYLYVRFVISFFGYLNYTQLLPDGIIPLISYTVT